MSIKKGTLYNYKAVKAGEESSLCTDKKWAPQSTVKGKKAMCDQHSGPPLCLKKWGSTDV